MGAGAGGHVRLDWVGIDWSGVRSAEAAGGCWEGSCWAAVWEGRGLRQLWFSLCLHVGGVKGLHGSGILWGGCWGKPDLWPPIPFTVSHQHFLNNY